MAEREGTGTRVTGDQDGIGLRAHDAELLTPSTSDDPRVAFLANLVDRHSAERRAILERARLQRADLERATKAADQLAIELEEARAAATARDYGAIEHLRAAARRRARGLRRRVLGRAQTPAKAPGAPRASKVGGPKAVRQGTVGSSEPVPALLSGGSPGDFRRELIARLDTPGQGGLRIMAAETLDAGDPQAPLPPPADGWPDVVVLDTPTLDIRRLPRHIVTVARVGTDAGHWLALPWFDSFDVVLAATSAVAGDVRSSSSKVATAVCGGAEDSISVRLAAEATPHRPGEDEVRRAVRTWAEATRVGLLVQAPTWEDAETSGDYHFARDLQRALERAGHPATVYLVRQWELPVTSREDVLLHLWGRYPVATRGSQVNALWVLYHPELVTADLLQRYDHVFAGSEILADRLKELTSTPVESLHQATDPERVRPHGQGPHHELLFIGNSRGTRRTILDDLGPTARDLAVYGLGWTPELLDPRFLQPGTVAHAEIGNYYASADIALNDHWPEAAEAGLITNRLYDILAAGGFALTDPVPGLREEFDDGVATYSGPADLALQVERLLTDPELRAATSARGRAAVMARHTFSVRVERLLDVLLPLVSEKRSANAAVPIAMARATCPVCLIEGDHERFLVREMMFGTRETFPYVRCSSCGTLRIEAIPVDLGHHYPPQYHYGKLADDVVPGGRLARQLVRLAVAPDLTGRGSAVARLARHIAPVPAGYARWRASLQRWAVRSFDGGVLDVGTGRAPDRLVVLRALGFTNLLGIDPFIEKDLVVHGVPVRKARLEDVTGSFDLVWFHHSLEHVPDPRATLRAAVAVLAPGGRIVVRIPVMESVLWDRYGTCWWELDAPRHLYLFTPRAIVGLAESLGLRQTFTIGESTAKEFVGSEQYRRDLAMFEPGSWFLDPAASAFTSAELQSFDAQARAANAAGTAGRACFVFERA